MSGMNVDGLISGMQTSTIISQLVELESRQRNALKTRQSTIESQVSALQGMNTKVMSLNTAAKKLTTEDSVWGAVTGSSTDPTVTVTAKAGTGAMDLSFKVNATASNEVGLIDVDSLTAKLEAANPPVELPPAITILTGGKLTTISPSSGSAQEIAAAINKASEAGITATAVRGMDGKYTLQITGKNTGATDGQVQMFVGKSATQVASEMGIDSTNYGNDDAGKARTVTLTEAQLETFNNTVKTSMTAINNADHGYTQIKSAADASITLWAGSSSEKTITSKSNTFENLVDGVSITVGKDAKGKDGENLPKVGITASVNVVPNQQAAVDATRSVVDNINLVLSEIASRTATTKTKESDGREVTKLGLLTSDSNVRALRQSTLDGVFGTLVADGQMHSPSELGITTSGGKDGTAVTISFDETKFREAMAKDPVRAKKMIQELGERFATISENFSGRDGMITQKITASQGNVKDMQMRIDRWDYRLEQRKASLTKQFTAMETTLGKLQKQSDWLAGQIKSLPGSS